MDLIDRAEAIDAIGKKSDEIYITKQKGATYPHDDFFQGMAYAESIVKQLPSVQPEIEERNGKSAQNVPKEDLISRKAAIDAAVKMFEAWYGGSVLRDREIRAMFEALPAAEPDDLVAVVRCRDCKYNSCSPDHGNACCDYFYGMTDQMGFCNYGERRTDETD